MPRLVRLDNISDVEVVLDDPVLEGGLSIPAYGRMTVSYDRFTQLAILNDFPTMRIDVEMAQEGLKTASVKDFGAKGNGSVNDTQAIQRAIDFIAEYGGGVVDIPVGVYPIDGITVRGDVMLQGESRDDSVLKMRDGEGTVVSFISSAGGMDKVALYGGTISLKAEDCDSIHISDSSLRGSSPCVSVENVTKASSVVLENCILQSVAEDGGYYAVSSEVDIGRHPSIMESFCLYE